MSGSMICRISRARSVPNSGLLRASSGWRHKAQFSPSLSAGPALPVRQSPNRRRSMLNHISIGVSDIAKTKRFYDAALKPLGYACLSEGETSLGYGKDAVALWILAANQPVPADEKSGLH